MARVVRLGIAVGATRAVGVVLGRVDGGRAEEAWMPPADPEARAAELFRVFTSLARDLGSPASDTGDVHVHLVLAPPLADARLVELPPLRHRELLAVLQRDAPRHFLGAKGPRVVGVRSSALGGRPELVAAAELSLLEAAREAVEQCGWALDSIGVAHGSWISAVGEVASGGTSAIMAVDGPTAFIVRQRDGTLEAVRQASTGDPSGVAEALGRGPGRLLLCAPDDVREALEASVMAEGWLLAGTGGGDALALAAEAASRPVIELRPPSLAARRDESLHRRAVWLGVAAAALLVMAAGAHLWGTHRELDAVRAERLRIADRVSPLLLARDSLERLTGRVEAMDRLVASTPRWTPVLAEIASLLPRDSYLTGLFTSGDTLELEAAGSRAGEAIQQLRASGTFSDVSLKGVVQRELENGETVVERFRVSARVAPPKPPGVTQ